MKHNLWTAFAGIAVVCFLSTSGQAQDAAARNRASAAAAAKNAAWTPPVGLPAPLVSATASLFAEGLADPRGGDYRQISVQTGSVWSGDGGIVETHGWVLPTTPSAPATGPRAVCWNGLVYPVVSVGGKASLSADVAAIIKADDAVRAAQAKANPSEPYFRFLQGAIPERQLISETSLLPLKAALLVRLGEGSLAQKFWAAWQAGTPPRHNDNDDALRDPYLLMADEWVSGLFDRAVTAHMRGDDQLSLVSARELSLLLPVAEAEALKRGYRQTPSRGVHEAGTPFFPYLGPLPRLLADEERRVAETKPPPPLPSLLAISNKTARIAALIEDLDQVAARQDGQPGSVSPDADPIVQALVAQGDDAVQPLIDTVRDDTRLTRSVGFGRDFFPDRYLVSVAGAAYAALVDILHTSEFGATGLPNDKAADAAALQTYWDKYKNLEVAERWYRVLADDTASPAQWIGAAHEIVRPSDESLQGGWIARGPGFRADAPVKGEALRRGHTPTVSDLMARRVSDMRALSKTRNGDSRQFNDVDNATTVALYFSAWDARAAEPTLHDQFQTERGAIARWQRSMDVSHDTLSLTKLTLARTLAHDPAALTEYVAWLQTAMPKDLPLFSLNDLFEPLWRLPNNPAAQKGAEYLFLNPHSPWVPFVHDQPGYGSEVFEQDLEGPLLLLPAFRQAMLISLADRTVLRTVTLGGPDPQTDYNVIGNDQDVDPFRPSIPQAFPIRRCDLYAWHLARLGGMPTFQYDWSIAKKNAAIAEAASRLRRYGANFGSDLPPILPGILPGEGGSPSPDPPKLRFPRLTRPATAADVAQNKAIFALEKGARVLPVPAFPLPARWVTDRRYPPHEVVWTAPKTFQKTIGYAQDGFVWQAEESQSGRRFYGFVGPHDIARVPAEDMEFPPADIYAWTQIAPGLDCTLTLPGGGRLPYVSVLSPGQALPLTLHLRSRRGVPQTLPADYLRHQLTLKLLFSADEPDMEPRDPGDPKRVWEAVSPQTLFAWPPAPSQTLAPVEEFAAWTGNPLKGFHISRSGTYRLQFVFASGAAVPGRQSPETYFRVTH